MMLQDKVAVIYGAGGATRLPHLQARPGRLAGVGRRQRSEQARMPSTRTLATYAARGGVADNTNQKENQKWERS
jgi:hypothetical protein